MQKKNSKEEGSTVYISTGTGSSINLGVTTIQVLLLIRESKKLLVLTKRRFASIFHWLWRLGDWNLDSSGKNFCTKNSLTDILHSKDRLMNLSLFLSWKVHNNFCYYSLSISFLYQKVSNETNLILISPNVTFAYYFAEMRVIQNCQADSASLHRKYVYTAVEA